MNKIFKNSQILIRSLFTLLFLTLSSQLIAADQTPQEIINEESQKVLERCSRIAKEFYSISEGEEFKEITDIILNSAETKEVNKKLIIETGRRFFIFKYPSDGFQVKGFISFVPNAEENPLLIFLRGGNRIYGILNPAIDFTCAKNYTVISTTYRGGVSEGTDEFGGEEVNDVHNLLEYFPVLQEKIGLHLSPKKTFLVGNSRGGMEMFLALNQSPSLQYKVDKAVSLSGLLDVRESIHNREDMMQMCIDDFGLQPGQNEEEWITKRNPISNTSNIRKDLPILIIQGTADIFVNLDQGYHMVDVLKHHGSEVTYFEVHGGDHGLLNQADRVKIVTDWLEE